MARERNRLTDVVVKRLLGREQPGMHPDGAGLYLRIRDGGGASWTFRYKLHGKDRWLDIGDPCDTSLARARVLARAERAKVDTGQDPIAERRAADDRARKRGTFAKLAEEWYAAEDERRLKHPTTANDLLRHLKAIFAFGIRRHRVDASPVAAKELAADSKWVFPARRRDKRGRSEHVGKDTLNVALGRVKYGLESFTIHDFRRTARTQLSELDTAPHVAEACLNHKPRGVERVYNRHSYFADRRAALQVWADLLVQIETGQSNVVPIRRHRSTANPPH